MAHAAASPSSAEMWMNCPASITKAEGRERPASRYAKEGTAAHKVAETIIGGDLFPPGKLTVEGDEFIVGLPMLRALRPYINIVEEMRSRCEVVYLEQKVVISRSGGWVWGTADCVGKDGDTLEIVDLKYGRGVPVDPDSSQLKIYGLASWETFWPMEEFRKVSLTICQPRLDPLPKTYVTPGRDLQRWNKLELAPAIGRIAADDKTEKVGTYCRWCARKPDCDTFKVYKNSLAANIFDDGVDTSA